MNVLLTCDNIFIARSSYKVIEEVNDPGLGNYLILWLKYEYYLIFSCLLTERRKHGWKPIGLVHARVYIMGEMHNIAFLDEFL